MKLRTLIFVPIVTVFLFISCASVTDSIVSVIDEEQYNKLNNMYWLIQDFRFYNNRESLDSAKGQLDAIDLDKIYNNDYKAKILGYKALTHFYLGDKHEVSGLLRELEELTKDEEMFWVVSALMVDDKAERLNLLIEGNESVYSIERMNSYLAYAYLENEEYGEATALYDTILLEEADFTDYYKKMRGISFLFMQNPPGSFETGMIIAGDQIHIKDLVDMIYLETPYFAQYNRDLIEEILKERRYFFEEQVVLENPLFRKELAYFLFALIADSKDDGDLWRKFDEYYNPDLSDEMKDQLEGMSPIPDIPAYRYYFYPVLYLVEDEIMELPDGENFFPNDLVDGTELIHVIANLEERLD